MSLAEALTSDRAGDIEAAAELYEAELAAGRGSLEVHLRLAGLYWQATDVGLACAKRLGPDLLATAWSRCRELLDEAIRRFPTSTEARFWRRYIEWADLDAPFDPDECRQLLREDPAAFRPRSGHGTIRLTRIAAHESAGVWEATAGRDSVRYCPAHRNPNGTVTRRARGPAGNRHVFTAATRQRSIARPRRSLAATVTPETPPVGGDVPAEPDAAGAPEFASTRLTEVGPRTAGRAGADRPAGVGRPH